MRVASLWTGICLIVSSGAIIAGLTVARPKPILRPTTYTGIESPFQFLALSATKDTIVGITTSPKKLVVLRPPTDSSKPMQVLRIVPLDEEVESRLQTSVLHNAIVLGTTTSTLLIDSVTGNTLTKISVPQNNTSLNPTRTAVAVLREQNKTLLLTVESPDLDPLRIPLQHADIHDVLPAIAWHGDGEGLYIENQHADETSHNDEHAHDDDIVNNTFISLRLEKPTQITQAPFKAFRITDQPGVNPSQHLVLRAHDETELTNDVFDRNNDGVVGTFSYDLVAADAISTSPLVDSEFSAIADVVHCTWESTVKAMCFVQWIDAKNRSVLTLHTAEPRGSSEQSLRLPRNMSVQTLLRQHTSLLVLNANDHRLYAFTIPLP